MIEELYKHSLEKYGPEDPGTKRLKERLELAKEENSKPQPKNSNEAFMMFLKQKAQVGFPMMPDLELDDSTNTDEEKPKPTQDSDSSLSEE